MTEAETHERAAEGYLLMARGLNWVCSLWWVPRSVKVWAAHRVLFCTAKFAGHTMSAYSARVRYQAEAERGGRN